MSAAHYGEWGTWPVSLVTTNTIWSSSLQAFNTKTLRAMHCLLFYPIDCSFVLACDDMNSNCDDMTSNCDDMNLVPANYSSVTMM